MDARERGWSVNTGKLAEHTLFAMFTHTPPDPSVPGLKEFVRSVEAGTGEGGLKIGEAVAPDAEFAILDKIDFNSGVEQKKVMQERTEVLRRALLRAKGHWVSQRNGTPGKEDGLRTVWARLDKLNRPTAKR